MPLDAPDWQSSEDRSTDALFNVDQNSNAGLSMAPKQVNVYEGVDVFYVAQVDSEVKFTWDQPVAPTTGPWQYVIEVLAGVFLSVRLPNRGQRLQMTAFAADALMHNYKCVILPTARVAFGFEGSGNWVLVLSSGTIAGGATVNVPFNFPYHGPATLSVKCASDNYRCELQGRDALGLQPNAAWAGVRNPHVDHAMTPVTVPPLINQCQLVNHSPASAAYTVAVVPSYQFT